MMLCAGATFILAVTINKCKFDIAVRTKDTMSRRLGDPYCSSIPTWRDRPIITESTLTGKKIALTPVLEML